MEELGAAVRRLVGQQPVRLRYQSQENRFLLQDVGDDARVAALVRHESTLQLCGPVDAAPLVLDIDALTESGGPATAEPLGSLRLQVAARVVGEALRSAFGLSVHWFGSGLQGLQKSAAVSSLKLAYGARAWRWIGCTHTRRTAAAAFASMSTAMVGLATSCSARRVMLPAIMGSKASCARSMKVFASAWSQSISRAATSPCSRAPTAVPYNSAKRHPIHYLSEFIAIVRRLNKSLRQMQPRGCLRLNVNLRRRCGHNKSPMVKSGVWLRYRRW